MWSTKYIIPRKARHQLRTSSSSRRINPRYSNFQNTQILLLKINEIVFMRTTPMVQCLFIMFIEGRYVVRKSHAEFFKSFNLFTFTVALPLVVVSLRESRKRSFVRWNGLRRVFLSCLSLEYSKDLVDILHHKRFCLVDKSVNRERTNNVLVPQSPGALNSNWASPKLEDGFLNGTYTSFTVFSKISPNCKITNN